MRYDGRMRARAHNPAALLPWIVTVGLAGVGVGGVVMARRALAAQPDGTPPGGGLDPEGQRQVFGAIAATTGGGAAQASPAEEQTMRNDPLGHTSFFTPEVEQQVIGQLQAYKNQNGTAGCDYVYKNVSGYGGIQQVPAYIRAAEQASRQILNTLWPSGRPWDASIFWTYGDAPAAEAAGLTLWRAWLWFRVMRLADEHVCNIRPVT